MMRTANPVLHADVFAADAPRFGQGIDRPAAARTMTVQGTATATMILLGLCSASAVLVWGVLSASPQLMWPVLIGSLVGGLVLGIIMHFKHTTAPYLAPLYAIVQGGVVGGISLVYAIKSAGSSIGGATGAGIVLWAALLTFSVLFALLAAYKSRLIRATENFKLGVTAATMGIGLFYLVNLGVNLFWPGTIPSFGDMGWIGIAICGFVVVIASLNLVLDFDFIEQGEAAGAPKYMEWYAGFGLLVTLIWLYIELLRLLYLLFGRRE